MKKIICVTVLLFSVIPFLFSCNKKSDIKDISELMGDYGDVEFSKSDILSDYVFANDVYCETTESGLHANTDAVVYGKAGKSFEVKVIATMPTTKIIPAEESESGEEEKITEYKDITAYVRFMMFTPSEVLYDSTGSIKENVAMRLLLRVSSHMWDEKCIPLSEGDEAFLYLQSTASDTDIMKIKDRGFADFVLYDGYNGVIKKVNDGYIFSEAHTFLRDISENYDSYKKYEDIPAEMKRCYASAGSYEANMKSLYYAENVIPSVKDNIKYYLEK